MIRYLLDEHIPPYYRTEMLRREPSLKIWRIGEPNAPAIGTLDPELLRWCEENQFILVTNNRRSIPGHLAEHLAAGRHIPGIMATRRFANVGDVIEQLVIVAMASYEGEHKDLIRFIPW